MKPWPGVIWRWITWAGLSCGVVTLALRSSAAAIPELAARGIEQYRKGDATVAIHFSDGRPASGVQVEINQTAHGFRFGNVFRPRHYTNLTYRARFVELFNFVELLEFNWGQYEPVEGRPQLAARMLSARPGRVASRNPCGDIEPRAV